MQAMFTIEGNVVLPGETRRRRVEIDTKSGLIARVGEPTGEADLVTGNLVFPSFGDIHVHAREDASGKQTYKEDFLTASAAAIHGGVAFIADMPNNPVAPVDDERWRAKAGLVRKADIEVVLYAAIAPGTSPLSFPVPYKLFMAASVGDVFFDNREDIRVALARYRGQAVSFHAEDPEVLRQHADAPDHAGKRPAKAEADGVELAIALIEEFGLQGKICHLSTAAGLKKLSAAKARGVAVTAEVTPHHLFSDLDGLTPANRNWLQMNPPLRTVADREALIAGLKDGSIDYLATDHAPHTREEKEKGTSGVPHLDTYGPFVTWLMANHGFSPQDVARVAAENPARFVRPYLRPELGQGFGRIAKGYVGSLTVIDPHAPTVVRREDLKTKCGWSPFEGVTFPGSVYATIIRGKVYKF